MASKILFDLRMDCKKNLTLFDDVKIQDHL